MNQSRTAILVGFIVILAFIAGYKGETLAQYLSFEKFQNLFSAVSGAIFKPQSAPSESVSGGSSSLPNVGFPATGMPGANPVGVRNVPGGGMMSSVPTGGFQFSSIPYGNTTSAHTITDPGASDGADSNGGVPKNAYFEKLSEQMRELRQQNMVQTFSVPSEPSPPSQMFSSAPGIGAPMGAATPNGFAPEHFPMEAPPPPSMMPAPTDGEIDPPNAVLPPEENEDLTPPEIPTNLDE